MRKLHFLLFTLMLFTACSHINEGERLIYVKPANVSRRVLLEDFTGQRCVNCPKGTAIIEQLLEEYGDAVIAVGIHGGPLGFKGNTKMIGLATDIGDEYYNHWQLEYQPVGLIDRHGAVNYTDWTKAVKDELAKVAPLNIMVEADVSGDDIHITVTATGTDGNTNGKLQVWLLEDGISALQTMPDGTTNRDYVHNHVLRTPVNGTWGEDISIGSDETKTFSMQQAVDAQWDTTQLSIVAFVYNDDGVMQAAKVKVINNIQQ
jgi:hypothetical protein